LLLCGLAYVESGNAEGASLEATLVSLNPQKFPFIYVDVAVVSDGVGISTLSQSNFQVSEDGILQTDYFAVTPPEGGGVVGKVVDIVFLMDNSGSMLDEQSAVRNHITDFVNDLDDSEINFTLGLCRFGAYQNSGYPIIEDSGVLTCDVEYFKDNVWARNSVNGGFEPGWDALYEAATGFSFRPGAHKVFILITDETPGDNSNVGTYTQEQAISTLQANSITMFALLDLSDAHAVSDYGVIAEQTAGAYYDILDPFDEILNYISSQVANTYRIRYRSSNPTYDGIERDVQVIVSYQGEQATCKGSYTPGSAPTIQRTQETLDLHNQSWAAGTEFTIKADITDNVAPYVQSATLYYRKTADPSYSTVSMTSHSDEYWGTIPGSAVGTPGLDYYISATDGQSTVTDPSTDPRNYPYQIAVLPNKAPQITHTPVTTSAPGTAIRITAEITDTTNALREAKLFYRRTGQILYQEATMANTSGDNYSTQIPASYVTTDGVDYYIYAEDDLQVGNHEGTLDSPHQIIVETQNQSPTANAGPDQTVTDTDGDGQEDVTLDGSGSDDPDGAIASWVWTESGNQLATGETPTITLSVGTHTITLTVTDDSTPSLTDTDEVAIVIASGHAVNSPNEPSGHRSGGVDELLEFSTSGSACSKGHPVEYQFNWDSAGKDDLSKWSSSTSASHRYPKKGTYQVKARARCAVDASVKSGWSAPKTVTIGPPSDEHAPTADASDIDIGDVSETMYPDTPYTVTAKYYDADGRDNLNICYLRLNHPSRRLTMMWYQENGNYGYYAGEEGESYLTITKVRSTEITNGTEGYELAWTFKISNDWPEVENAIDFGVFAEDDDGLKSGDWHYDDTNASYDNTNQPPNTKIETVDIDSSKGVAIFTWSGSDKETPSAQLVYKHRLLNPDSPLYGWSNWSSSTTATYPHSLDSHLPDGTYRFQVKAKDEGEAIGSAATSDTFTIGGGSGRVPVIIIPGVMGSYLRKGNDIKWNPDAKIEIIKGLLPDLCLTNPGCEVTAYDIARGSYAQLVAQLVREEPPNHKYHDPFTILYPFEKSTLESVSKDNDLFVFPYDWRQDLKEVVNNNLKPAIDEILRRTGSAKVDIVAHSMGGLISRYYVNKAGGTDKVSNLILVGVPHFGSLAAYAPLHPELGCFILTPTSSVCLPGLISPVTNAFQSSYELLPTPYFFRLYDYFFIDRFPFGRPGKLDGNGDPIQAFCDTYINNSDSKLPNQNYLTTGLNFHNQMGNEINTSGSIFVLTEWNIPTPRSLTKTWKPVWLPGWTAVTHWSADFAPGDKRVLAEIGAGLKPTGDTQLYNYSLFTSVAHGGLLNDGHIAAVVKSILEGHPWDPEWTKWGIYKEQSARSFSYSRFEMQSNASFDLYDSEGRHTGFIDDGIIETSPVTQYLALGDSTIAAVPSDDEYQVEIVPGQGCRSPSEVRHPLAEEEAYFTFIITKFEEETAIAQYIFDDIPISSTWKGTMQYDPDSSELPTIRVDSDGDGSADLSIPAELGNSPLNLATPLSFYDGLITVSFGRITSAGHTVCQSFETLDGVNPALNPVTLFYWLSTSALFSGSASITIRYDESDVPAGRESDLKLYRITGEDAMEDITLQLDQAANTVTGQTDGFSYFVVGYVDESHIIDNVIAGPNPVPDTGTAFFYTLPVGTSTAKLMVLSATSGRLLFETSIDVNQTRFPVSGTWDPVDNDGVKLANGPYLYVLIANGELIGQGKMVIQR